MVQGNIMEGGKILSARFAGSAVLPVTRMLSIDLPASAWEGSESPYVQTPSVGALCKNSRVDLFADEALLSERFSLLPRVVSGSLKVYAIGVKPGKDMVVPAAVTLVKDANESVVGAAAGAPKGVYTVNDTAPDDNGNVKLPVYGGEYEEIYGGEYEEVTSDE